MLQPSLRVTKTQQQEYWPQRYTANLNIYFLTRRSPELILQMAFHCNISTLTKAITGVEYKGGPHKYKPKKAMKRRSETTGEKVKSSKRTPTVTHSTQQETMQATSHVAQEDTLSSSLSSSNLPTGLFE